MGVYLWSAVQECWPPTKHRSTNLWDTVALFYFWKDSELQAALADLCPTVQRDDSWPEESADSYGYIVKPDELEILRQLGTNRGPLYAVRKFGQRFDALEAAAKAITRNPVRVLFWKH